MYCEKCGNQLNENDKFCAKCGAILNESQKIKFKEVNNNQNYEMLSAFMIVTASFLFMNAIISLFMGLMQKDFWDYIEIILLLGIGAFYLILGVKKVKTSAMLLSIQIVSIVVIVLSILVFVGTIVMIGVSCSSVDYFLNQVDFPINSQSESSIKMAYILPVILYSLLGIFYSGYAVMALVIISQIRKIKRIQKTADCNN